METRATKIVTKIARMALVITLLLAGFMLLLLGGMSLLLFFTDPDVKGDGFSVVSVVLAIVFLSLGVAMLLGGVKLLPSAGKKTQNRHLEKPCPSRQMNADSDNPSRGVAGPSQDTRINTPETQSMYCPNCGAENKESANFCRQCGQALSAEARVPKGESIEGLEKGSDEPEGDTEKGQKEAEIQNESGAESKKESEDTNRDKLLRYAVAGVIILVALFLIGSCGGSI